MKISIIIPVYNVAPYVKRCLNSVAAQTYTGDMECILVDDCGTDNSMHIAREWIKQYQGSIHFLITGHQTNKGLSAARNSGIAVAQGDYVYFLDSDDAISPDCIETLVRLAVKYPDADFVQGNCVRSGEKLMDYHFRCEVPEFAFERQQIDYLLLSATMYTAWNRLVFKSFLTIHSIYFPVGIVHEDHYWLYFLAKHTKKVAFTNKGIYLYYKNENSIMTTSSQQMKKKRLESFNVTATSFFEDILNSGATSEFQRQYISDTLIHYMQLLCSSHIPFQWFSFWKVVCRMAWLSKSKMTLYRLLFFLCLLPPLCYLATFNWWRWRIRHFVIPHV